MTTVKELVTQDQRTAVIFEKYGIDFCCNGGKTLDAACEERGLDPSVVLEELHNLKNVGDAPSFRPDEWDLDALADYIMNNHHRYVRRTLPVLLPHLDKVLSVHGGNHPELAGIAGRFHAIAAELAQHMQKEEIILFPYIKALAAAERDATPLNPPPFGSVRHPIAMMEREHRSAGDGFSYIRSASAGLTPPPDACTTYTLTYRELDEFERDLHQHIHLENNILFPKAIALEEKLFSSR